MERIAREILSPDERKYLIKHVDIIGDIAVIKIHPFLIKKRFLIAKCLLKMLPNVRVVYRQVAPTRGSYRIRGLEWLAGERRSITKAKEYGCSFIVDIERTFYTPRLSYEHMRVARLVRSGEVVVNMFAGIGPFSIIIAKYAEPRVVYSIDINPVAYELMKRNIEINKVADKVIPIHGDAATVILRELINKADRVLLPLPMLALKYLPFALLALKSQGGFLHLYVNVFVPKDEKPCKRAERLCSMALNALQVDCEVTSCRRVRSIGPRLTQIVMDIFVRKGYCLNSLISSP